MTHAPRRSISLQREIGFHLVLLGAARPLHCGFEGEGRDDSVGAKQLRRKLIQELPPHNPSMRPGNLVERMHHLGIVEKLRKAGAGLPNIVTIPSLFSTLTCFCVEHCHGFNFHQQFRPA
jgi:hypothetical protein